jgi:hypothetical protein
MARQRATVAGKIRLILDPQDARMLAPDERDPRLVALVRLLARQAARDFVDAEMEATRRRDVQD